jgi:hypothetical protein
MSKTLSVLTILCLLFWASRALTQQSTAWRPGQFGELTAGKSTRKDVVRLLGAGQPKRGARLETYAYPHRGDFSGDLFVEVNRLSGIVETITVQFPTNLTRTQAYKKYGRDYNEVNYSIGDCSHEGLNPPAYRDPKGPVELIEYPSKGLVLWPNREGFDFAAALYLAKPLPKSRPNCGKH